MGTFVFITLRMKVFLSVTLLILPIIISAGPLAQRPGGSDSHPGSIGGSDNHPGSIGRSDNHPGSIGGSDNYPGYIGGSDSHPGSIGGSDNHPGSHGRPDYNGGSNKRPGGSEYLSVPGFKNCLKNLDKPHHTQYCLPQTEPSECLDNSWKKLKTIFNSPCQGVGVSNYSSRSEAEAENSANLFSSTKIMILIPFLTKILLI